MKLTLHNWISVKNRFCSNPSIQYCYNDKIVYFEEVNCVEKNRIIVVLISLWLWGPYPHSTISSLSVPLERLRNVPIELRKCPGFLNVPKQWSCGTFQERSKGILREPSAGTFRENSQGTFLEHFAWTFREHFLGMFLELFSTAFRELSS